ncbi:hypothetical protein D3C86_1726170 [compost metagenome]
MILSLFGAVTSTAYPRSWSALTSVSMMRIARSIVSEVARMLMQVSFAKSSPQFFRFFLRWRSEAFTIGCGVSSSRGTTMDRGSGLLFGI